MESITFPLDFVVAALAAVVGIVIWRLQRRSAKPVRPPFPESWRKLLRRRLPLLERLTPEQRALAHAYAKLLEEHTYWAVIYSRWLDAATWSQFKPVFFGPLPPGLRGTVAALVQRKIRRDARGHGLGLHAPDEIYRRAQQDIDALAAQIGAGPYFFGADPASIDATVYAWLAGCWESTINTPLKPMIGRHSNLIAYCARMRARCFPELPPLAAA